MVCAPASAQEPDPWIEARFHLGPVALAPTISVASLGVDSNVLAAAENPERDWTFTATPGTMAIIRFGRARLTGQGEVSYQYFRRFAGERSLSTRGSAQLFLPLNRLQLTTGATTLKGRQRQGTEITSRVRRYETGFNAGVNMRIGGDGALGVVASRLRYSFPEDEQFLGTNLRRALARDEDLTSLFFTKRLTPLTTFRLTGETQRDRFDVSAERNATTIRATAGVELNPQALVKGSAFVGYQHYKPVATTVPEFDGLVASANLSYVLRGMTRFSLVVDRNLSYSYDIREAYYAMTGITGGVSRHLTGRWELLGSAGRQTLNYRGGAEGADATAPRRDWTTTYGAGLGYAFGTNGRARINVDRIGRHSVMAAQNYQTMQVTSSLDYAF
jgi:hypothetical protein